MLGLFTGFHRNFRRLYEGFNKSFKEVEDLVGFWASDFRVCSGYIELRLYVAVAVAAAGAARVGEVVVVVAVVVVVVEVVVVVVRPTPTVCPRISRKGAGNVRRAGVSGVV